MSSEKWSWVSFPCLLLDLSLAFGFASALGARRAFLEGVFCSVGRSEKGHLRLSGGGEVSSEVGEEGRMGLLDERVVYVRLISTGIVQRTGGTVRKGSTGMDNGQREPRGDNCGNSDQRVALALFGSSRVSHVPTLWH